MPPTPLVSLRGVRRIFDGGRVIALDGVDLAIDEGDSVAIVGRSGSGKSCVVNLLAGLDLPSEGEVLWRGQPVKARRDWAKLRASDIGIVFQEFHLIPTLSARENVEIGLFGHGIGAAERRSRSVAALAEVGLGKRAAHQPNAMSGGERQRTAIARALVRNPRLLLADEPTGNLDTATAHRIAELLLSLHDKHGMTLVVVTHDDAFAARFKRQVRLVDGHIVEDVRVRPAA